MKKLILIPTLFFAGSTLAQTSLSWAYKTPYNPIDVEAQVGANSVNAVMTANGGTLQLKAADGSVYTLELPKNAILNPTTVTMTLLDSVSGIPVKTSGPVFGVQLSPDGLVLHKTALLKMTLAQDIPVQEQLFLSYRGTGKELGIPFVLKTKEIQMQVEHFSGYVTTRGFDQDLAPLRDRLGGKIEDRIHNALADELARERQNVIVTDHQTDTPYIDFAAYVDEFIQNVIIPRVAVSGNSCGEGLLAEKTVAGMSRTLQLLGVDSSKVDAYFLQIDIAKTESQCMQEEYANCHDHHVVHRIRDLWMAHERRRQEDGIVNSPIYQEEGKLVEKCLNFEIEFQSQAVLTDEFSSSMVSSNLPLRFSMSEGRVTGTGPLTNTFFKFENPDPKNCTVTSKTGDASFSGMDLVFFTKPTDALSDVPSDISLYYAWGQSTEQFRVECKDEPPYESRPGAGWSAIFAIYHSRHDFVPPSDPHPGMRFKDWKINVGSELYAENSWNYKDSDGSEKGLIRIYHRPK